MQNTFSNDFIKNLYNTKVDKGNDYLSKWEVLPPCPVKKYHYQWRKVVDFPRIWTILDFIEWGKKYDILNGEHLGYTYKDPEIEFTNYNKNTLLTHPPHDLHTLIDVVNKFDFFVFNQTLEHLYNPFLALSNIYNNINDGGYVFTSVPTLNIPHMTPIHFNGFTPMGLAMLFVSCGFEIVEIGQWGNYEYIKSLWKTHKWRSFKLTDPNAIIKNEKNNVCQCWVLAKKPKNN